MIDAVQKLHDEEDQFMDNFILEIPINPVALVFICIWHFLFGCLYMVLIAVTKREGCKVGPCKQKPTE